MILFYAINVFIENKEKVVYNIVVLFKENINERGANVTNIKFDNQLHNKKEEEKKRIFNLKKKYDNDEIQVDQIDSKDIEILMNLYGIEADILNQSIESKRQKILEIIDKISS